MTIDLRNSVPEYTWEQLRPMTEDELRVLNAPEHVSAVPIDCRTFSCGCVVGAEGIAIMCKAHAKACADHAERARQQWLSAHRFHLERQ